MNSMDKTLLRMKQEIRDLKQLRQRSSATVATKSVDKQISFTLSDDGNNISSSGRRTFRLKNLSDVPMLFDVKLKLQSMSNYPSDLWFYYWSWVDQDSTMDYYISFTAYITQPNTTSAYTLPVVIQATSDFEIEEIS